MLMIVSSAYTSASTSRSTGFTPVNSSPFLRRQSARLGGRKPVPDLKPHHAKRGFGSGRDGGKEVVEKEEDEDEEMDEESDEADQVRIRTPPEKGTWSGFL